MLNFIVISCDKDFHIKKIMFDSFNVAYKMDFLKSFHDLFFCEEKQRLNVFITELKSTGIASKYSICLRVEQLIKSLDLYGIRYNEEFLIIALEPNNEITLLYDELMKINNEQSNLIRQILKERFLIENVNTHKEEEYGELTKLNNELANLQRVVSKKNIELEKLNEIKDQFLSIAAHDLRNPISKILNYIEFILDEKEKLSQSQIDSLNTIQSLNEFMIKLIDDLLDVSKIETGNLKLRLRECDIIKEIESQLKDNRIIAAKKSISIKFEKNYDKQILKIDKDKFSQALNNLISNAIKYSYPDSGIVISVLKEESFFAVTITDKGVGIEKEDLAHLFKPFMKGALEATKGEKGTGLGLYIVKKIIESHRGIISVESEPGRGSSFSIKLPFN